MPAPGWKCSSGNLARLNCAAFWKRSACSPLPPRTAGSTPFQNLPQTVVAAFSSALQRAGITLLLEHKVTSIRKTPDGFSLSFEKQPELACTSLLLAAGGQAYPTLGSRGECFPALAKLGHTVRPLLPALGPVSADMHLYHSLQGVRLDARVTLFEAGKGNAAPVQLGETAGNLISPGGGSTARQ